MHPPSPSLVVVHEGLPPTLAVVLAKHDMHIVRAETIDEAGRVRDCAMTLVVAQIHLTSDDPRCRGGADVIGSILTGLVEGPSRPRSTLVLVTYDGQGHVEKRLRQKTESLLRQAVLRAATSFGADLVVNALMVPVPSDDVIVAERLVAMADARPPITTGEVLHLSDVVDQSIGEALLERSL